MLILRLNLMVRKLLRNIMTIFETMEVTKIGSMVFNYDGRHVRQQDDVLNYAYKPHDIP